MVQTIHFSELVEPFTSLTRKNVRFEWGEDQKNAFETLKTALKDPKDAAGLSRSYQAYFKDCSK